MSEADARLAEIRERVDDAEKGAFPTAWYGNAAALAHTDAVKDLRTLLAERDLLAGRVKELEGLLDNAWKVIVRLVPNGPPAPPGEPLRIHVDIPTYNHALAVVRRSRAALQPEEGGW